MISAGATILALTLVIDGIVKDVDVICVENAGGEYFRKVPTLIEDLTSQKRRYTFYLSETEGNTTITKLSFWGGTATVAAASGTKFAEEPISPALVKNSTQSLTVYLELEAV